jgi:hypothetical protein
LVRVAYVGDGGNDLCPCVRLLAAGDLALPRSGFTLARRLKALREDRRDSAEALTCGVEEWGDWDVLAEKLRRLL